MIQRFDSDPTASATEMLRNVTNYDKNSRVTMVTGEYGQFNYDDNSNRTTSTDGDPFGNVAATEDSYSINEANEYAQITRDSAATNPRRAERRESSGLPQRRRHL